MVAAFVALVLGLFIYKEITLKDLAELILNTAKTTAIVLFLCGMAMLIPAPILLPVMERVGIDPVYFGVIMSINLGIGFISTFSDVYSRSV